MDDGGRYLSEATASARPLIRLEALYAKTPAHWPGSRFLLAARRVLRLATAFTLVSSTWLSACAGTSRLFDVGHFRRPQPCGLNLLLEHYGLFSARSARLRRVNGSLASRTRSASWRC